MVGTKTLAKSGDKTFKFQSFSEQLSKVSIDVVHRIGNREELPEDSDTFFYETLVKWADLNCTEHFVTLWHELKSKVQSFALLVHHKEEVVAALKRHLLVPDTMALDALTELVVALARDMQADFYVYFRDFFDIIVSLLNTGLPDRLEQCFTCLAYLFKFLWRYLSNDIEDIFRIYSPLLSGKQKPHIRRFAAESFAFLMRKVKNPGHLFDTVFNILALHPEYVPGIGHLLFEVIKGIKDQFHSCTSAVLPLLLAKLGPCSTHAPTTSAVGTDEPSYNVILDAQLEMMGLITNHATKEFIGVIWEVLFASVVGLRESIRVQKPVPLDTGDVRRQQLLEQHLERVLTMMLSIVEYKRGILVVPTERLCSELCLLLEPDEPATCGSTVLHIASRLLLADRCAQLTPQHVSRICKAVYRCAHTREQVLDFSRDMFPYKMFEKDVLPQLVDYCQIQLQQDSGAIGSVLQLMVELVLFKRPLLEDASKLADYKIYPLPFPNQKSAKDNFGVQLLSALEKVCESDDYTPSDFSHAWAALVLLPHMRYMDSERVVAEVRRFIAALLTRDLIDREVAVLAQAYVVLSQLLEHRDAASAITLDTVLSLLKKDAENLAALRVADLFFTLADACGEEAFLGEDTADKLFPLLVNNLSSPYHQVRLLTLRVFCAMRLPLPQPEEGAGVVARRPGALSACLSAEELTPGVSVQTYRDVMYHLRRLDHDVVRSGLPLAEQYTTVPLRYLLGVLYVNFQLLWKPVSELIQSHGQGLPLKVFWEIYGPRLKTTADLAEQELNQGSTKPGIRKQETVQATGVEALFGMQCDEAASLSDRPDHANHRFLLWRAMQGFAVRVEGRSRDLSPLLLQFMENEFYPADYTISPTQDVSSTATDTDETVAAPGVTDATDETTAPPGVTNAADADAGHPEAELDRLEGQRGRKLRRAASKSLTVHLAVFARFCDPRSLYLEPRLQQLYGELLTYRIAEVQSAAFACLMTYKHTYLTPYRENFERLLDDKTFRIEIVHFSVSEDNPAIEEQHRAGVLPILMRILYGKMQIKTGSKSTGAKHANMRKSIVLRFLAACQQVELKTFIDLIFTPFHHFLSDDPFTKVKQLMRDIDYHAVIPLKRQISVLNTLDMIFSRLGARIESYLPEMFQITICLASICVQALEDRTKVAPRYVNVLKNIRGLCLNRILQFFTSFDKYPFTAADLDAVFEVAVWPQLPRIAFESAYNPSVLLKLFQLWSENPRFHSLLGKHHADNPGLTPLAYVFQLLSAKNVSAGVLGAVMGIVERLLAEEERSEEEEEEEEGSKLPPLEVNHCLDVNVAAKAAGFDVATLGFGTALLMPHIPTILDYLRLVVDRLARHRGRLRRYPQRELAILRRASALVRESSQCAAVVRLLLPFLQRDLRRPEVVEVDLLVAAATLMRRVDAPACFVGAAARLFGHVAGRASRIALCNVLQAIAAGDGQASSLASVATRLNAWDRKRLDEPDYETRLSAFHEANRVVRDMEPVAMETECGTGFLLTVIHNCFFYISTSDDMSLRDSASHCLQQLIVHLASVKDNVTPRTMQILIDDNCLAQVKIGIKHKSESAKHEYVAVLAQLVRSFPEHAKLKYLLGLMDVDPEADFFENMRHIQIHRRGKALKKLQRYLQTSTIHPEAVMSLLLPLATTFLFHETYAQQQNIIDDAINTLGATCALLPWKHYEVLLRRYLSKLSKQPEYQKQSIKCIVVILDAFHFDLSLCEAVDYSTGRTLTDDDIGEAEDDTDFQQTDTADVVVETETDVTMETEKGRGSAGEGGGDSNEDVVGDVQEVLAESSSSSSQANLAARIHKVMSRVILPPLHRALTQKVKSDGEHKLAKKVYTEDQEVLRVPIALAMVKLLQKLPKHSLHSNLPNVLLKLCELLRSRARDVRDATRDTIVRIVAALGPAYLHYLLREMRATLRRGYQRHVLTYTTHAVLRSMAATLRPGELDGCVKSLTQVFQDELFGEVNEEKDVDGITRKVMEAKSVKGYDAFEIMAKFIGAGCLSSLIAPLEQVLDEAKSHKVVKKVQDVLSRIALGLVDNTAMPLSHILQCAHALSSESLSRISAAKKTRHRELPPDKRLQPANALLLPAPPGRGTRRATATAAATNAHVLVEFGLQLLLLSLKRERAVAADREMLDPFAEVLLACLSARQARVVAAALRCLCRLLRVKLPSLQRLAADVAERTFALLREHAVGGGARGDNADVVAAAFRAAAALVREAVVTDEQLQLALALVEQDLDDAARRPAAFTLLRAILVRRLAAPALHDVVTNVGKMAVRSEEARAREQCRDACLQYMLGYPLGARLRKHVQFWAAQLEYERAAGRASGIAMCRAMIDAFPRDAVAQFAGVLFVPLAARLANDDAPACRRAAAAAVAALLRRLDGNDADSLASIAAAWTADAKPGVRRLGAQVTGIVAEVEGERFERRLATTLPIFARLLREEEEEEEAERRAHDHLLFNILTALAKILRACQAAVRDPRHAAHLGAIWRAAEEHLLHLHTWVRLAAAQLFGLLFSAWEPDELVTVSTQQQAGVKTGRRGEGGKVGENGEGGKVGENGEGGKVGESGEGGKVGKTAEEGKVGESGEEGKGGEDGGAEEYLSVRTHKTLHKLAMHFCSQLQSPSLNEEVGNQVIKNLVYLAKVFFRMGAKSTADPSGGHPSHGDGVKRDLHDDDDDDDGPTQDVSENVRQRTFLWLLRKICKEARIESSQNPKATVRRSCVFKWLAAVALELGGSNLSQYLYTMLLPLHREITNTIAENTEVKNLASEVMELMKTQVGVEEFSRVYAMVTTAKAERRLQRKRSLAVEVITDPQAAVRKKIKRNLKKQDNRKRKIETKRPGKKINKRKKLSEMAIQMD